MSRAALSCRSFKERKGCFAVTEPDAGLDTTKLKTTAVRKGNHYIVSGRKVWTRRLRSRPRFFDGPHEAYRRSTSRPRDSASFTRLDRSRVEIREIEKMGRHAVDSNLCHRWSRSPEESRIGMKEWGQLSAARPDPGRI